MAVALDTTLVGAGSVNGANSIVLSNFSTGGTNRICYVYINTSNDSGVISSVTATGLTFSRVGSAVSKGSGQGWLEVWAAYCSAQQTNVAITVNTSGFPQAAARTICFSGIDTTGTVAGCTGAVSTQATGAFTTTSTASVTTTRAGSLVFGGAAGNSNTTMAAGSGQTLSAITSSAGGFAQVADTTRNAVTPASGTSVSCDVTWGTSVFAGIMTIEVLAPSGGAAAKLPPSLFTKQAVNRASTY